MLLLLFALAPACAPSGGVDDTAADDGVVLTGRLADPAGVPLGDVVLQACASVCYADVSAPDGTFAFALSPGSWSLKVAASDRGDAPLVVPLALAADRDVALTVPRLDPPVPVPDAADDVAVTAGLSLRLSAEGLPGIDAVAAAALPAGAWPPLDGLDGVPTAAFALSPLGAGEDVPFTAEVAGTRAWCTDEAGTAWVRCDAPGEPGVHGRLPHLGTLVVGD
ncbi:MAG: hypothetical protein R3F59_15890 [Myxococcota bacterium]